MNNDIVPSEWFANSKQVKVIHNGNVLGFCLANTLLKEVAKKVDPPEGNPIIQELFHDYNKQQFLIYGMVTQKHEEECRAYIKKNIRWEDLDWHFQPLFRGAVGKAEVFLGRQELDFQFEDECCPDRLYKYVRPNRVKDFLERSTIYLSAPTKFNDPFDCPFSGPAREKMEKIGISCLSGKGNNSLMFSHYADEHRGVCLIFAPSKFSSLVNRWGVDVGGRVQRVCYYNRFPDFDEEREPAKIATSKNRDWNYEDEYRLTTNNAYRSGVYTFDPDALIGIIFGVRTSEEKKEEIYKSAKDTQRSIEFYQARKSDHSYNLDIVRVGFDECSMEWSESVS